jgi:hypothetical protein
MKNYLSPEKYIKTKASSLPYYECFINENWKEQGMATIFISKKQPSGNLLFAMYLVDVFCLGLKNTMVNFNYSLDEYENAKEKLFTSQNFISCELVLAHNIIFGAIDYAEELGFYPHKDFTLSKHLLNNDLIDDGIDEIDFGKNGKPMFVAGPDDNAKLIISKLEKALGKDNFTFIYGNSDF